MKNHPLFKYPDFRNLFLGRLITATGDKFFAIVISWWIVLQAFANGDTIMGVVMGSSFLGIAIFGPFTGALADRYSKKKCMLVAMVASGVIVLIMLLFFPVFRVFPLVICVFYMMITSLEPMFTASAEGAIAYLVDEEDLPRAVALSEGILSFSAALGAAFAGVFIAVLGVNNAFLMNAISFFAAAFFVFRIKTKIPVENDINKEDYFEQLKAGFTYIKKEKEILALLIVFGSTNFFLSPLGVGIVLIVSDVFKGSAVDVSIMEVALAVGAIVVSIVMGSVKIAYDKYKAIFFGFLFAGVPLLVMSILHFLLLTYFSLFCIGMALGLINITAFSIFQQYVSPRMKGRFFSILTTICFAVIPLGNALVGICSEHFGIERVVFVQGIFIILISFAIIFIPKVKLENMDNLSDNSQISSNG